jgi:hypothetical protein
MVYIYVGTAIALHACRWKSWLGGRGHGTVVNADNLHRYDPNCRPPQPQPTSSISRHPVVASKHNKEQSPRVEGGASEPAVHWDHDPIPLALGVKYATHTWRQTTTEVEIRFLLPDAHRSAAAKAKVTVEITPFTLKALHGDTVLLNGTLQARAYVGGNCDDRTSTWYIADGVLVIHLSKWLRQSVGPCTSAADTWWPSLFQDQNEASFARKYPPNEYYDTKSL